MMLLEACLKIKTLLKILPVKQFLRIKIYRDLHSSPFAVLTAVEMGMLLLIVAYQRDLLEDVLSVLNLDISPRTAQKKDFLSKGQSDM